MLFWRNGSVIVTWHDVYAGDGTLHHDIISIFTWNYLIIIYIYYYHTNIMQISIYFINNMPEPGRNLAADACMGQTQLSPCIYNFSTMTIRASRNAIISVSMIFFHAEPLISRFSLKIYTTLLQQLWQTTNVEPVSYICIIKPTGCQNNPGRVFPLDASASIPVLVICNIHNTFEINIIPPKDDPPCRAPFTKIV